MQTIFMLVSLLWIVKAQLPTIKERNELTSLLQSVRAYVVPAASDMMLMNYSDELEALMYKWVNRCDVKLPNASIDREYQGTGMILNKHLYLKPYYEEEFFRFLKQQEYYNYECNTCWRACPEYKMLIYAKTTHFGCAMQSCKRPTSNSSSYVFGCLFKPGVPRVIERPYTNGTSCSMCPEGYECYKNQCKELPPTDLPTPYDTTPSSDSSSFTGPDITSSQPSTSPSAKTASSTVAKLGVLVLVLRHILSTE
uniref:SCP domain-containing protein n=1 Tax=Mesocestoides corti TaxID=53468 RepID=A0A5K3F9R8_MESCO